MIGKLFIAVLILSVSAGGYEKFHGGNNESWPKLNYDSLYTAASSLADSPDGRQIVEKCLAAYGGIPHLEKLNSVTQYWRMLELMTRDSVDINRTAATGRRYKIEKKHPGGFEERMIDGDQAWFQTSDTLISLNSGRYKAELFSYLVLSMPLAIEKERFDGIRYGIRADDPLHYLYFDKQDSLMLVVGIDPDSHLIRKAEGVIRQDSASFVFINLFDDHRENHGYIFPHSLTNISMGLTVGRAVLKNVEVNFDPTASFFSPIDPIGD